MSNDLIARLRRGLTDLADTFEHFLGDIGHGQDTWQRDKIAEARTLADTAADPPLTDIQRSVRDGTFSVRSADKPVDTSASAIDEKFLMAYVSKDAHVVGIEHDTEADWNDVFRAHVALRDRLNERIAENNKCPIKPEGVDTSAPADVGELLAIVDGYRGPAYTSKRERLIVKLGDTLARLSRAAPAGVEAVAWCRPSVGCEGKGIYDVETVHKPKGDGWEPLIPASALSSAQAEIADLRRSHDDLNRECDASLQTILSERAEIADLRRERDQAWNSFEQNAATAAHSVGRSIDLEKRLAVVEQALEAAAARIAAAQTAPGVPDGWQLVPTKHEGKAGLTHEMCRAFWVAYQENINKHGHFESTNHGYNAMLAAAPTETGGA